MSASMVANHRSAASLVAKVVGATCRAAVIGS
jgi:hypothetical protein